MLKKNSELQTLDYGILNKPRLANCQNLGQDLSLINRANTIIHMVNTVL